jgi:gluconokinase
MFFGLAQHHSIDYKMRALLEGICFEIRSLVEAVEQQVRPADAILASGGFVRSNQWVQMLADVLGRDVIVSDVNDASSLGAAIVGFESLGIPSNFAVPDHAHRFSPDPDVKSRYDSLFEVFGRLAGKLTDEFGEIASMQAR